ncbi:MAG TPA: DedA family protein [Thermoleophilaceae bacterium]|jgi:membrane protein DedA with SNARE-associated domain
MTGPRQSTPWEGKAERADLIIIAGITISGLYALILLPLVPSLVGTHPLLLELIRGSMTSIVTMGALARTGHAHLWVALLASIPALIVFDWAYWWAGRRWGNGAMRMLGGGHPKGMKRAERVQRLMGRWGAIAVILAYVLPVPTALVDAAAGWARMRFWVFIICDALGALLWTALLVALGYGLGQHAVDVVHKISHYSLYVTLAIVAYIVIRQARLTRAEIRQQHQEG